MTVTHPTAPRAAPGSPGAAGVDDFELLRCLELSRSFGQTRALRSCSIAFRAGEVHAVIGENGSGKSTLVKVLSGVLAPDGGSLEWLGRGMSRIDSPAAARALGIATVFQEVLVVPSQTILENVWLGVDGAFRRRVPAARKHAEAAELMHELTGERWDLTTPVEHLDLGMRQVCVLARALVRRPRVLILDESTSALDVATRDRLFEIVRRRCGEGVGVVFISHRMDEIEEICDRMTVLRAGESVATHARGEVSTAELLRLMSGEESVVAETARGERRSREGRPVLRLRGVRLVPDAPRLDAELRAGEIVGVAGLEGHGQERFLRVLAGIDRPADGEVVRERPGGSVRLTTQRQAAHEKIAYVPRDRRSEGVFEPLSIADNFSLPTDERDATLGVIRERRRQRRLDGHIRRLRIRLGTPRDPITSLSGGTQQKVIIARWLAMDPEVLLLNDPTRGVDLTTKHDIYELLGELAQDGMAIVVLSTEVEEHLALMDRVLVFREGQLFAELDRERLSRRSLVAAFFGRHEASHA